jgi:long-chain acyl-CoA synthetase
MNPLSKLTLHAILERSADEYKQQMALTFVDGEPITFAELHKQVGVISAFLHDRGVAPGDRVAILSGEQSTLGHRILRDHHDGGGSGSYTP